MCFSAEASFAVGGALIPVGGYCVAFAVRKRPSALGLALVPLGFAIQQISEGFVWLRMNAGEDPRPAALVYLFFALAFWPFWFSFCAIFLEKSPRRRWLLAGLTLLATFWFWVLYFPLLGDQADMLKIEKVHHSIQYDIWSLPLYQWVSPMVMKGIYLLSLGLPFIISTDHGGWLPGLFLGGSILVTELVYHHAFVSVWCFFAAVLSVYVVALLHRVAAREQ